ncbi:transposable element Tcb1 transposase [Trichonephila clavipes]|nr:transposable element Tcb1 transposase [Trichonephila clavipes]
MADSVDYTEELEKLAKEIPEGINMEEFVANVSKLAAEFYKNQRGKPVEIQVVLLLVFLLIPISLIPTGTTVSRQPVNGLLGQIGLYARRPVRCVPLIATHRCLRLAWSREHALWIPQQWVCVMFPDEFRLSLQSDSHRIFIWRAPGTRYHQENVIERHHFGCAGLLV